MLVPTGAAGKGAARMVTAGEAANGSQTPERRPTPRRAPPSVLALGALVAGIAFGAAAGSRAPALLPVVRVLEPLGALWVGAIRMTIVPLVVSLLVTSIAGLADARAVGRLGARTLALFVATLVGVAVYAALLAPPLFASLEVDPSTQAALRAAVAERAAALPRVATPTLRDFVVGLVPANPVRAAADGAMLPLIVFTACFAAAAARLERDARERIVAFFRATGQAMLVVVRWVIALAPLGVFALAADLGARVGVAAAGAVGYYVLALCALITGALVPLYVLAAVGGRTSLLRFARAVAPAQAVAAGTRSSLASLPALIDGARRVFGDRPAITGFVLPLAVATFKAVTPISHFVGPLFLAHVYGVPVAAGQYAAMLALAIVLSFSSPGIPSGGVLAISGTVLLSIGVPIEGLALLIAADAIPDVFSTVFNVTADMAVATVVGGREER